MFVLKSNDLYNWSVSGTSRNFISVVAKKKKMKKKVTFGNQKLLFPTVRRYYYRGRSNPSY